MAAALPLDDFDDELDRQEISQLRDEFAGQALVGMLSGRVNPLRTALENIDGVATEAYLFADAMLKARAA